MTGSSPGSRHDLAPADLAVAELSDRSVCILAGLEWAVETHDIRDGETLRDWLMT